MNKNWKYIELKHNSLKLSLSQALGLVMWSSVSQPSSRERFPAGLGASKKYVHF